MGERSDVQGGDVPQETELQAGADNQSNVDDDNGEGELFASDERRGLESRWNDIQAQFVDEPRASVEEANALVEELMNRLVSMFSEQRARLEQQWDRGEDVTTEDLRVALRRYRSFFGRLLELRLDR